MRLDAKRDEMDTKEREVLRREGQSYVPTFWAYLDGHYNMMKNHMVEKVGRKAGLPNGNNGKPLRSYTNCSESMNHVMKVAKDAFLRENPCVTQLSKLQFTKSVFEVIHAHQIEELQSAIAGVSDAYVLADYASYLQVPADVWFEWSPSMRLKYVRNLQKLSVDDIFEEKDVRWPSSESTLADEQSEFTQLSINLAVELTENFGYTKDHAETLEKEVLYLHNHPRAIPRKASIETAGITKYEVASTSSKNGALQVSVFSDHVACICGRYHHDLICKHSLAVAALQGLLPRHLRFTESKSRRRVPGHTSLAEHNVDKNTAGKKGSKNKYNYRPARGKQGAGGQHETTTAQPFTAIHHNDNPFVLKFLHESAKRCKACDTDVCHKKEVISFDLVFEHKERWFYPVNGDWSNRRASQKESTRYYHTTRKCMIARFPYFEVGYVQIPDEIRTTLRDSHKNYLASEMGLVFH